MRRKILLGMVLSVSIFFWSSQVSLAAYRDDFPDFDGILIDQDTTWTKDGHYAFSTEVKIVDGAKLTIEPGTQVSIEYLIVLDGYIVAEGTESEPIHFTRQESDYSRVPEEYAPYDKDCYYTPSRGTIEFASFAYDDSEPSVFRFVEFDGMGASESYGADNCPWSMGMFRPVQNFFTKTANASGIFFSPVLKITAGRVRIEHSTFKGNHFADIETDFSVDDEEYWYDEISVTDSNFEGNTENRAVIAHIEYDGDQDFSRRVLLKNNWYGSPTGPMTVSNPAGQGEQMTGTFHLDGWSVAEHGVACAEHCFSNVMFLPGLESSRLYKDGALGTENQLWEPNREADVEKLFLDDDGKSSDSRIYTRDVLDEKNVLPVGQGNIYKSFIEDMDVMKNVDHSINDWKAIPYDWRLSLDDIVNNGTENNGDISYIESAPKSYIVRELERLAGSSKSGKVTIIAHSNGGLVAKALIHKLGDAEAIRLIDQVVLVAVPQTGTPQAIGAILHGYDQGLPFDWLSPLLSPRTARILANNMPGAYHLLPSTLYFSGDGSDVETPPITFGGGTLTDQFIQKYGHEIGDASELRDFLSSDERKVSADSEDTVSPSRVNTKLLSYGKETHRVLDAMTIPESIAVSQIAGFGEETLGTIKYWTGVSCKVATEIGECDEYDSALLYTPEGMIDGDGTVVAPSALAMRAPNVKRYWVDLKKYETFFRVERKHADILEVRELRDFIKENIIMKSSSALPNFISDSQPPTNSERRLRYSLHSPLALSIRDNDGRETSATASDIPGARYRRFGEVQYISVPAVAHPILVLDGEAKGSFTLEVKEVENEVVVAETTFAGIPSTAKTKVTLDFPDGTIGHATPLTIDYDGDGRSDHELAPVSGGTVLLDVSDTVPPTTGIVVAGTEGLHNWYTSDVTLTLTATDNEGGSGMKETKYSLDDGMTWNIYATPLISSSEGTTSIQYFSTDTAGNREESKTQVIKIDRTAPEAKIQFNSTTQKLDIIGRDNLGQSVVVATQTTTIPILDPVSKERNWYSWLQSWYVKSKQKTILTTTLTDEAGHETQMTFEKRKDRASRIDLALQSIEYDSAVTNLTNSGIQYKWQKDWRGKYILFASYLSNQSMSVESHFLPKRNETWIMERPRELADEGDDESDRRPSRKKLSGMVVPGMVTERGAVKIKY